MGIGGVSMRALAELAESRGHTVTGSDAAADGHRAENVDGADLVVYTNAVKSDNCELVRARALNIPTIERAEYLGEISRTYDTVIAVSGCHGKSTAAAMLGAAFGSKSPTVHVGVDGASRVGGGKYFITEACEYRSSFLKLSPDVGIVLNVGYDHPDYYGGMDDVIRAYGEFCGKCKTVLVNGDDPLCMKLCGNPVTFGLSPSCTYRASSVAANGGARSFVYGAHGKTARIDLSIVGAHNVYNALAALAAADVCGIPTAEAARAMSKFTGLSRRFERKGIAYGKTVICDYAHHPAEIAATINTAREIFPSVAVVFQPHTYSRTAALLDDFVTALEAADTVVLAPIFAAREKNDCGISSHTLCRRIVEKKQNAYCFDTFSEIIEFSKMLDEKAIIFMGAGDICVACDKFMKDGAL